MKKKKKKNKREKWAIAELVMEGKGLKKNNAVLFHLTEGQCLVSWHIVDTPWDVSYNVPLSLCHNVT